MMPPLSWPFLPWVFQGAAAGARPVYGAGLAGSAVETVSVPPAMAMSALM